jgi:hypothetical protein
MMGGPDPQTSSKKTRLNNFLGQVPAVALIGMFHLMIGIPFGVSYFPVSWSPLLEEASDDGGPFPLPGKEALGIRMFLFSTIVGQIVFTIFSDFPNPIGLQVSAIQLSVSFKWINGWISHFLSSDGGKRPLLS